MLIEVRTDGRVEGGAQRSAEVTAAVHAALARYGDRIRRVEVHLSDAIGQDGDGHLAAQNSKCCMIDARRDGHEAIVVRHKDVTIDQAIHGAIHNLKRSIDGALEKEASRNRARDHH